MDRSINRDRRHHKRYFAKKHVFAVVRSDHHKLNKIKRLSQGQMAMAILKSNPPKMGEVIEISRGGMSFSYIANKAELGDVNEIDILFADDAFHLSRLPFKPVKDTAMDSDTPFNAIAMKRQTIEFVDLTPDQKTKLNYVLQNYTTGQVPESTEQP